jgi:hypothetical protein
MLKVGFIGFGSRSASVWSSIASIVTMFMTVCLLMAGGLLMA